MSGIDEVGMIPLRGPACVLLSGGMDSTAALHWTLSKYRDVRAIGFDYGQPHRDAELVAAGRVAGRLKVPFEVLVLADALGGGLLAGVPNHGPTTGIHRAFVPGRNLVFLSIALSRSAIWWPHQEFDIVIGACKEDSEGFPDCTKGFITSASETLGAALGRKVNVAAPYVRMTKAQMLEDVSLRMFSGIDDILRSWSCYRGDGPCGTCTPCVLRTRAFDERKLPDLCERPRMTGGDVGRDRALRGG